MTNTSIVHVGTPPVHSDKVYSSALVFFHNVNVDHYNKGSFVESSFCCFGEHELKLRLYPRGSKTAKYCNELSLEVINCSDSIVSNVQLIVKNKSKSLEEFGPGQTSVWDGVISTCTLSNDKSLLVQVSLTFDDVYVQMGMESMKPFIGDEKTSDIAFQTTDCVVLCAHTLVLKAQAPDLYDLCERFDKEKPMPVDVDSRIFSAMLGTLYGNAMIALKWTDDLKCILKAADKYGFAGLKAEADKWYVKATELTVDNVVDELLYADGNGHVAMKETAINFIVHNANEVVFSDSYDELYKSKPLIKEVISNMGDALRVLKK